MRGGIVARSTAPDWLSDVRMNFRHVGNFSRPSSGSCTVTAETRFDSRDQFLCLTHCPFTKSDSGDMTRHVGRVGWAVKTAYVLLSRPIWGREMLAGNRCWSSAARSDSLFWFISRACWCWRTVECEHRSRELSLYIADDLLWFTFGLGIKLKHFSNRKVYAQL